MTSPTFEKVNGANQHPPPAEPTGQAHPAPDPDAIAGTSTEAPRFDAEAWARAEAIRLEGEAKAEAIRRKMEADERRAKLAEEKAAAKAAAEIAKINAETEAINEQRKQERKEREEANRLAAEEKARREVAARKWRHHALGFAIVCALVALPVQIDAFWSPAAPWLVVAPVVLEGGAWVVLRGADAAVADHRPHWHYRLIAWLIAAAAATINLAHGLSHFDAATAIGTAFASLAGPGVWDLHEHGRIHKRDGVPTRAERRAQRKAEQAAAAEREAAEQAERERIEALAAKRAEDEPKVWERALAIASAVGELLVTDEIYRRAWFDVHGAEPGETVDVVRSRNVASLRMSRALAEAPQTRKETAGRGPSTPAAKTGAKASGKRPAGNRAKPVPPRRRKGDSQPFSPVARRAASLERKGGIS